MEGPLPLTIRNGSNGPRSVRLEFRGDRVAVAQDGDIVTVPPGETTLELDARARALGVSTLEVTALTPDRAMVLSSTRYQIRSTAIPGLGWAISGSALLFLLLWWFRTSRTSTPRSPHLVGTPGQPENPDRPAPAGTGGGIAADAPPRPEDTVTAPYRTPMSGETPGGPIRARPTYRFGRYGRGVGGDRPHARATRGGQDPPRPSRQGRRLPCAVSDGRRSTPPVCSIRRSWRSMTRSAPMDSKRS